MNRSEIAELIAARLDRELADLTVEFRTRHAIQTCVIDDLLPEELARAISFAFPQAAEMREQKSLREHKFTAKQLDDFAPIVKEATFAFQQPNVLTRIADIAGLNALQPDPNLYAGGISQMTKGNFLLPHLDNSHDKDRRLYRVLNLLYYVTPEWNQESGGNLELWDRGPKHAPREIACRFNRLVLMATHERSWHSVSTVIGDRSRSCISNYYFSVSPAEGRPYFHVTSFRGRPEQPVKDMILRADSALRNALRGIAPKGIYEPEVYRAKH